MDLNENETSRRESDLTMEQELEKLLKDLHVIFRDIPTIFGSQTNPGNKGKAGKYLLTNHNNANLAKCMVSIDGSAISEADLALKLSKNLGVSYQSRIYPEKPWRLQQIQDSMNQIKEINCIVGSYNPCQVLSSHQHISKFLEEVMYHIKSAKDCLMLPKRKTLEDLVKNPFNRCFNPALPNEIVISYYIQGCKLVMAVYYLYTNQVGRVDILNRHQTECIVPWLNKVVTFLTFALWKCQQLKDKLITLEFINE